MTFLMMFLDDNLLWMKTLCVPYHLLYACQNLYYIYHLCVYFGAAYHHVPVSYDDDVKMLCVVLYLFYQYVCCYDDVPLRVIYAPLSSLTTKIVMAFDVCNDCLNYAVDVLYHHHHHHECYAAYYYVAVVDGQLFLLNLVMQTLVNLLSVSDFDVVDHSSSYRHRCYCWLEHCRWVDSWDSLSLDPLFCWLFNQYQRWHPQFVG